MLDNRKFHNRLPCLHQITIDSLSNGHQGHRIWTLEYHALFGGVQIRPLAVQSWLVPVAVVLIKQFPDAATREACPTQANDGLDDEPAGCHCIHVYYYHYFYGGLQYRKTGADRTREKSAERRPTRSCRSDAIGSTARASFCTFCGVPSTPVLLYCTTTLHNHSSGASIAPTLGYLSTHFRLPPYPSATRTTRSQGSVMSCKLSAVSLS